MDAINAAGGIKDEMVQLPGEDDQCDPEAGRVRRRNRIVADGIKFVDGHACSGSSIPASAVYAESGVLMMSPASSNPALTDDAAQEWLADDHAPLHPRRRAGHVHRAVDRREIQGQERRRSCTTRAPTARASRMP